MFDFRLFGLLLVNLWLAPVFAQEQRDRPGRWAVRARGSPFDADFGKDFTQLDAGLRYKDVKTGDGPEIVDGSGIRINFAGYILGDGKKFDSTWDKGRLVAFKVGLFRPLLLLSSLLHSVPPTKGSPLHLLLS